MFHCPRALFVRRGGPQKEVAAGPSLQEAVSVVRCPRGHATQYYGGRGANGAENRQYRLATCDCCAAAIDKGAARHSCRRPVFGTSQDCNYDLCPSCHTALLTGLAPAPPRARAHSSLSSPFDAASSIADAEQQPVSDPEPIPRTLPCGYCGACKASPTPHIRSCKWCCRDAVKRDGSMAKCKNCEVKQSWSRCLVRKRLADAARACDHAVTSAAPSSPASPAIGTPPPPPALPITPPTVPAGEAKSPSPSADAAELERLPFENAIAHDYCVVLVIVTASALSARDGGGPMLRRVLAQRGVRRIYVDEAHTVSRTSMAAYNSALAGLRNTLLAVRTQLASYGHPRPQIVGLTSTLPPHMVPEVKHALTMPPSAKTIRCNIDRPELLFQRLPMPQCATESAVDHLQRVLCFLAGHAPSWALCGALVVFCPTAALARDAATRLQVPVPVGAAAGMRQCIAYLGTNCLSPDQRTEITATGLLESMWCSATGFRSPTDVGKLPWSGHACHVGPYEM